MELTDIYLCYIASSTTEAHSETNRIASQDDRTFDDLETGSHLPPGKGVSRSHGEGESGQDRYYLKG